VVLFKGKLITSPLETAKAALDPLAVQFSKLESPVTIGLSMELVNPVTAKPLYPLEIFTVKLFPEKS
jgi:hypothetical protein